MSAVSDGASLFLNRELSLLAFQRRVLEEALDPGNPLLGRVRFLSIAVSNLDEFFMVRVAVLKQQVASGVREQGIDGRSAAETLEAICAEVTALSREIYSCFSDELVPALQQSGIHIADYASLDYTRRAELETYFLKTVFPVLTPLAFDPGRPFPHISNLSLNLAIVVRDGAGAAHFARVKVPDTLPQLVPLSSAVESEQTFVWMEQLITSNLQPLFPGLEIVEAHPFHVTRDAEVAIQELESDDLLDTIEEAVWRRRFRTAVRMQVSLDIPSHILEILTENLEVDPKDIYRLGGPLDLSRLRQLPGIERPDLKYSPLLPYTPPGLLPKEDVFELIRREDVLLHHPFESFQPVIEFLRKAARDPDVLAIKMTLYRVGRNSPVVQALLDAIEEGKQVAVMLELKARFDEESNIEWARALEREGVHVVYGLVGVKVHSKIALVVRREGDLIRRYVHLGTGNYNPITARLYTDFSLFTADDQIGADATDLFNYLTGYSAKNQFHRLFVAPINIRERLEELIRREISLSGQGQPARIILKMNALEDAKMIRLLYDASQAGVQIDLLVRGLCCLRPGLPGVSENIRVTSIVGRFLEHSRVYYFQNGGNDEVYLGSADLMLRNLNHRVEVLFPVQDARLLARIRDEVLARYLADGVKARRMNSDGTYTRRTQAGVDSQASFLAQTRGAEDRFVSSARASHMDGAAQLPVPSSGNVSEL